MSVIRSWQCLNGGCASTFDSWEANPECPSCRGLRVQWLPAGGHVGKTAKGADRELRALGDLFGMTDMNSAERGRAAKIVRSPPPAPPATAPIHTFAPGFAAPVNPAAGATCVPSAAGVDFKAKVGIGRSLAPSKVFPDVRSGTAIEASHKQ